ncbi:sensor histidine kinase [Cytophagaceae bacterium SJW1-29]|uniref:histidine kinase n=1 Tax=Salmonirosea aquatica TaxID=2654236 RepID=A0A7C9FPT4_9BACT|nr:sensor histidine kinase [Cytophagaceae bacterium SJW1-29]
MITFIIYYQKKRLEQEKNLRDVEKNYQRMLLETALNSEEAERRRIAQDLHDDIGTMLSLTKLSLNQLHKNMNKEDPRSEFTLHKAQSLVEETIIHVRRITRDLVPTTLEQFGLVAAIEEFIHRLSDNVSLTVHFQCDTEHIPRLSPRVELALYRIMQELVNNAIKHANCDEIEIDLHLDKGKLELQVTDNGKGFDVKGLEPSQQEGLGLRNIESRLSVINGAVNYQKPGIRGLRARVQIPVEAERPIKPEPLHPFRKSPADRSV